MNILAVDWHEAFIHLLAKTEHQFYILEPKVLGLTRIDNQNTWQTSYRPIPNNVTLISDFETLKKCVHEIKFDCVLAFTWFDLAFFKRTGLLNLFCPLDDFKGVSQAYSLKIFKKLQYLLENVTVAYPSLGRKEGHFNLPGTVFSMSTGIDPQDYGDYTGEIPAVLRVGNLIKERAYFDYGLQEKILHGLPHFTVGNNPDIPESTLSRSWDDLKSHLRQYRLFLAFYSPHYKEFSVTMAQLEAMATGMPVVATPHLGSIVEDGVTGFVSSDPDVLRERILLLLNDRDLARRLGENGRKMVAQKFNVESYRKEWDQVLNEAANHRKPSIIPLADNASRATVEWIGPFFFGESLASQNRKLLLKLQEHEKSPIVLPSPREPLKDPEDVASDYLENLEVLELFGTRLCHESTKTVQIFSPLDWSERDLPPINFQSSHRSALFFHADQGPFPEPWITTAKHHEQIWVDSHFAQSVALAQGIPQEKLRVIERGIDFQETPSLEQVAKLPRQDKFVFVFFGNSAPMSGGDIALNAYLGEFHRNEPVVFHYVSTLKNDPVLSQIETLRHSGQYPEITPSRLERADAVIPFSHNASFGVVVPRSFAPSPYLPNMLGAGLPIAAAAFGKGLDFRSWGTCYFVPTSLKENSITGEPELAGLKRIMRYVFQHPLEARIRGLISRWLGLQKLTWNKVASEVSDWLWGSTSQKLEVPHRSFLEIRRACETQRWLCEGEIHGLYHEWKEAMKCAEQCLGVLPNDPHAKALFVETGAALKDNRSRVFLESFSEIKSPLTRSLIKGAAYWGDESLIRQWVGKIQDTHGQLLAILGLVECGLQDEAIRIASRVGEEQREAIGFVMLGTILEEHSPLDALFNYEKAIELDPTWSYLSAKRKRLGTTSQA